MNKDGDRELLLAMIGIYRDMIAELIDEKHRLIKENYSLRNWLEDYWREFALIEYEIKEASGSKQQINA
ncbi:MAG: hypothetical protein IBX72_03930 [Nitrospirae bacterium]|nr:hypothetical protein [Nitrospirota bacterium]